MVNGNILETKLKYLTQSSENEKQNNMIRSHQLYSTRECALLSSPVIAIVANIQLDYNRHRMEPAT